jgi:hypothetical protein
MDIERYARQAQENRRDGQCFICRVVDGTHSYGILDIAESDQAELARAIRGQLE